MEKYVITKTTNYIPEGIESEEVVSIEDGYWFLKNGENGEFCEELPEPIAGATGWTREDSVEIYDIAGIDSGNVRRIEESSITNERINWEELFENASFEAIEQALQASIG